MTEHDVKSSAGQVLPWQVPGDLRITLPDGLWRPPASYVRRVNIGGLWVDNVTMPEAITLIERLIRRRTPSYVVTPNVDHVVRVHRDWHFRRVYRDAAVSLADGMPLLWAARILGRPLREKVSGSDLLPRFCEVAAHKGYRLYFMGGLPTAAERSAEALQRRFPGLQVVGTACPPYGFEKTAENQRLIQSIRDSKADVLFVGLGSPKQERWIERHCAEYGVPVSIGVGASLDFSAGLLRRAPLPVQAVGFEWLWRLLMEPRRLYRRYLVEDPIFFNIIWRQLRADRQSRHNLRRARQRLAAAPVPQDHSVDAADATDPTTELDARLTGVCVDRLRRAHEPATGLLRCKAGGAASADVAATAVGLLALEQAGIEPAALGIDPERSLRAMVDSIARRRCHDAAGLVIWANALYDGPPLSRLATRWETTLEELPDVVRPRTTAQAAWMVAGLVHELRRSNRPIIADALHRATVELLRRYCPATQLFCQATSSASLGLWLCRHLASFDDQITAVHALSLAALATGERWPLRAADACAARLVSLQGPLGQWWSHYNPRDGQVSLRYPLLTVHHHALAPLALSALKKAGGGDHTDAIGRGREWLARNELGVDLVDRATGRMCRGIEASLSGLSRRILRTRALAGWTKRASPAKAFMLRIVQDMQADEYAWCLLAAGRVREAVARGSRL